MDSSVAAVRRIRASAATGVRKRGDPRGHQADRLDGHRVRPIDDSWILLQDQQKNASNMSSSLCRHQPIQNEVEHSVISFYVNYNTFKGLHPHAVQIDAKSGSPNIAYQPVQYALTPDDEHIVQANEFTYVDVTIPRDVAKTYTIVRYDPTRDVNRPWPPLPP